MTFNSSEVRFLFLSFTRVCNSTRKFVCWLLEICMENREIGKRNFYIKKPVSSEKVQFANVFMTEWYCLTQFGDSSISSHSVFTRCSLSIHSVFTQYSLSIHAVFTQYLLSVHSVFTQYSLSVLSVFTQYSLSIHSVFTQYLHSIHSVFRVMVKNEGPK